ncbi:type II toxin-antitoxin system toxin DNA ADP-ribosyl transferase DarT [Jiella mangrovi]|uniref:DUF4433 domain-containing protein n=1 Tax=Jiella mangrovi TaxID=2821407 RepID=A0ABS4BBH6_9HYPH|nr:DUF4433 domain-containing protein [Jiella mangrovi]MBP0614084.1 DUF4433 domain-containing protein [Jiella mangrovi]
MSAKLSQEKALIFRILHRDNVRWLLANGMHCDNSDIRDPNYVSIGNAELIGKRRNHPVPCPPGGMLSDYVPFYFTPFSPMLYNIKTGYGGIRRRSNSEIVIAVSSLLDLQALGMPFVFTDRHAYLQMARYFTDLSDLTEIDWTILRNRDFKRDPDDPGKFERYQAEALVHRNMPCKALAGIMCYDDETVAGVQRMVDLGGLKMRVVKSPNWYF